MPDKKVLVVEDNELNMKLMRSILNVGGYQVIEASDAETGIDLAKAHRPALILMDIQLPGMDGFSATTIIKKDAELKNIPVIALTAYAMEEDKRKAMEVGCSFFISKPIDTKTFVKTLNEFLGVGQAAARYPEEKKMNKYNPRILIVDDVPGNVKLIAAMISSEGYEIYTAFRGEEAIEKVNTTPPDLILLDIMMPGMNGYEVTRILKENPNTKDIPIILVTSLDDPDEKAKGMSAGADEYLTKPVNRTELLTRIKSMVRLKQYQEQLTIRNVSELPFSGKSKFEKLMEEDLGLKRVLLVDDNDKDILLIEQFLKNEPYELSFVKTGEEAISIVLNQKIDLILLDLILPGIDGFKVFQRIKALEHTKDIQVVIITCMNDLESKLKGIELGVDDFLVKPINQREIVARVKVLLRKKSYIDKLHSHYDMAMNAAISDGLTGLYNHTYFKHFLDLEVKKSLRQNYPLALMMLDIDDFKKYNDRLGHITGDVILREIAYVIKENTREIDFPSRYGGEEFAVVLPYADKDVAINVSKRIMDALSTHHYLNETISSVGKVTLSIGIARCPEDSINAEDLIQKADTMLYHAKKQGKNRISIMEQDINLSAQEPSLIKV